MTHDFFPRTYLGFCFVVGADHKGAKGILWRSMFGRQHWPVGPEPSHLFFVFLVSFRLSFFPFVFWFFFFGDNWNLRLVEDPTNLLKTNYFFILMRALTLILFFFFSRPLLSLFVSFYFGKIKINKIGKEK